MTSPHRKEPKFNRTPFDASGRDASNGVRFGSFWWGDATEIIDPPPKKAVLTVFDENDDF